MRNASSCLSRAFSYLSCPCYHQPRAFLSFLGLCSGVVTRQTSSIATCIDYATNPPPHTLSTCCSFAQPPTPPCSPSTCQPCHPLITSLPYSKHRSLLSTHGVQDRCFLLECSSAAQLPHPRRPSGCSPILTSLPRYLQGTFQYLGYRARPSQHTLMMQTHDK